MSQKKIRSTYKSPTTSEIREIKSRSVVQLSDQTILYINLSVAETTRHKGAILYLKL